MDPTIELLNEVWSGARTGLTSLRAILDITDDTNLRNEIYRQETEYQKQVCHIIQALRRLRCRKASGIRQGFLEDFSRFLGMPVFPFI